MIQSNSKNKLSTMRLEYFPSLEYFWNLSQCDKLILTDHFQYSNKTIATISAPINDVNINLKIPLVHDKEVNPIFKKNISHRSNWLEEHLLTLKHQYKKQPYAYLYFPILHQILNTNEINLSRFLTDQITLIADWLHLRIKIYRASEAGYDDDNNQNVLNWCQHLDCDEYINSSFVFDNGFVDQIVLERQHIAIRKFINLPGAHIFQYYKNMSILSFLFQFGPEAGYILRQFTPDA